MCTLSLFRQPDGFRITMNRDECHDRIAELPPQMIRQDNSIFGPVDPMSGGTWIAKNENGFWGCLLNGYFEKDHSGQNNVISRGTILPTLLTENNPIDAIQEFNPEHYLSFRLLVGSVDDFVLYEWNGNSYSQIDFHESYEDQTFFLSSSSWKQDEVIEIRRQLFKQWVRDNLYCSDDIPDFHLSTAPDLESAPMMLRSYSGTKSITMLDVNHSNIAMHYYSVQNQAISHSQKELTRV